MNKSRKIKSMKDKNKRRVIRKKEILSKLEYMMDVIEPAFPVVFFMFLIGSCWYMFANLKMARIDIVLDFVIAGMSALVLSATVINDRLKDRQKYYHMGNTLLTVFAVGYLVILILAIRQKDSNLARIISIIGLSVSGFIEIKKYIKCYKKYLDEKNEDVVNDRGVQEYER